MAVAGRLEQAWAAMEKGGLDLLAISPSDDLRWLVGFSPTADERVCMLLVGRESAAFVVPSLNAEQTGAAVADLPLETWEDHVGPDEALARGLARLGLRAPATVAVDGTMRADFLLLLQEQLPGARCLPAAVVLADLRAVKDPSELESLAAAARTADAAVEAAFAACGPDATELDVAEAAAAAFRRAGCEEVLFTSVACGPNGAFPHHHSSGRRLQEGDAVTIDVGGRLNGYASDLTRMAHVGEPDGRYAELHDVVASALGAGLATARPGATCADVDRAAREVIEAAGLGEYFVHRTGHGLGLSVHEPPSIMAGEETELAPGMVFSVEPGVYLPGERGLRLEEIVWVTDTGCEVFSSLPRDVHVVPA
jgi:Xaa-Pro aminopeptidase